MKLRIASYAEMLKRDIIVLIYTPPHSWRVCVILRAKGGGEIARQNPFLSRSLSFSPNERERRGSERFPYIRISESPNDDLKCSSVWTLSTITNKFPSSPAFPLLIFSFFSVFSSGVCSLCARVACVFLILKVFLLFSHFSES